MVFTSVNVLIFLTVATVFVYFYYGYKARKQGNSREEMFGFFIGILIAIISSLALIDIDKVVISKDRLHVIIVLASFLALTVLNLFMRYKWHIQGLREFRLHLNVGRILILVCVGIMIFKTHVSWVHHV
ncbi:hypothetical protein P4493_04875 [Bacillus thuringiensis]|jgi:hypothetical protein|uniref:Membrane protein n=4 Tax=Bacillus thuringiensis TaxID=1428 RepID=A0A0B5NKU5_BACTU|nr:MULTISPECIES: hypothetical protein [Bacillus]EAO56849.1 hypothetical protein RBTH_07579 [Bacillus thuringiensis serovar israelensis ATCC 35646]MEC2536203.1 hypothetical protein [Bacillus cereus]MED1153673.1 hypothetical protein [Bacillus paranthracis]OUB09450.1 hypothetical protein BK708_33570 [Bacillus thuringiensis serovar yunnanensis]AFQ29994.1 hypothetical protein BTF1_29467 [Bacillus thuringiensis HD-789]